MRLVDVTLVPVGTGTRLTLHHSDLPGDRADRHQHGWTHFLGLLRRVASGDDVVTTTTGGP